MKSQYSTSAPKHNARLGFSLLEVLVALVIFAIGVTGMLVALGYNLRDISYTKDHALAVRLATREMNALRRLTQVPDAESTGSEGRFSWATTVTVLDLDDLPGTDTDEESQSDALVPCEMNVMVSWSDVPDAEPMHNVKLTGIELFEDE